jgi:hypothetical protein
MPTLLLPTATLTPEPTGITITGVITNLKDAEEKYIAEDSYLQLVLLPANKQLNMSAVQGRLLYESELAQIPIPHDGVFAFHVESLKPGVYLIAAQLLLKHNLPPGTLLVKSPRSGEYVNFEIPQNINLPLNIDLGEVTIPIPEP